MSENVRFWGEVSNKKVLEAMAEAGFFWMGVNYIWNKSLQKFVKSSVKDPKRTRQVKMRFSVIGDREMPHGVNLYAILLPAVNGTGKPTWRFINLPLQGYP